MNGIDRITEKIRSDAQAELDALRAQREAQFAQQQADARAEAEQCWTALSEQNRRDGAQQLERLKSAVDMDARKQSLALKQELIELAFVRSAEKLAALEGDAYVQLLVRLAVTGISGEDAQLILSESDRTAYGAAVTEQANARLAQQGQSVRLTLAEDCRTTGGGLILRSERMEVNCTFPALISRQRNTLAPEVAKLLFN